MNNFFNTLEILPSPNDLWADLDLPITQEEIVAAISSMQSAKSPGPDGFSSDFFKKFTNQLAPFLF